MSPYESRVDTRIVRRNSVDVETVRDENFKLPPFLRCESAVCALTPASYFNELAYVYLRGRINMNFLNNANIFQIKPLGALIK